MGWEEPRQPHGDVAPCPWLLQLGPQPPSPPSSPALAPRTPGSPEVPPGGEGRTEREDLVLQAKTKWIGGQGRRRAAGLGEATRPRPTHP